ncbi:Phage tail tube protein [Paenibacillaceae bacterium GAS479]|nr:Phage tail tube protein [Paenibacillaceae bacterium GAS479]
MDKGKQVVTGNDVTVWLNNEALLDISKLEYKMTGEFEDVTFLGDKRTYKRYLGFTGEGSLTFKKGKSRGLNLIGNAFKSGVMPDIKIVTKVSNPASGRAERIVIKGVTISEFGGSYEAKSIAEEEIPFSFSDYEIIETL